jgi:hypothetical protein
MQDPKAAIAAWLDREMREEAEEYREHRRRCDRDFWLLMLVAFVATPLFTLGLLRLLGML